MTKKSNGDIRYENEETYDNFDPKKDDLEWTKMINERDKRVESVKLKSKEFNTNCCTEKFERIFNSHPFHACVLVLTVLECFFVAGELIVNYVEKNLYKGHSDFTNKTFPLSKQTYFDLSSKNVTQEAFPSEEKFNEESLKVLEVLELVCKYGGFIILLIFIVEILIKVTLVPRSCCCKFFEIFDFVIVFAAFSLNLYFLIVGCILHGLSGLITILR